MCMKSQSQEFSQSVNLRVIDCPTAVFPKEVSSQSAIHEHPLKFPFLNVINVGNAPPGVDALSKIRYLEQ